MAWDPSDAGIDPDQIRQRISNILQAKRLEAQEIYTLEGIEEDGWEPWVRGGAAPAPTQPAAAPAGPRTVTEQADGTFK